MYARSILAMLAAIATLVFVVLPGQAAPAASFRDLGTTTAVTRASVEICEVCQVADDDDDDEDDDEEAGVTDLLPM